MHWGKRKYQTFKGQGNQTQSFMDAVAFQVGELFIITKCFHSTSSVGKVICVFVVGINIQRQGVVQS